MELIFGKVFHFLFSITNSYGWAILLISVSVSIVLMPFYHITNILEDREKTIRLKLQPYILRISKIKNAHVKYHHLSKLYRSYNYSPIMSLRSLSSLVIQVPFFIAAYQVLSKVLVANSYNSEMFFLFIKNLGLQDNLIGGVNLLPILMTATNILAVMCMTPFSKERRQGYIIAVLFLILLYMSPAGLVLYWTANNFINLLRYLFVYLKGKKFLMIKHTVINCFSLLAKNVFVRVFLFLISAYFAVNTMVPIEKSITKYSNAIVLPLYILFFLKLYDHKIIRSHMTRNGKIRLLLIILCFVVSCFVKRWEKVHWLSAALTLLVVCDHRNIKIVKIKKILKSLTLPVVGMLFPAILYARSNLIYINGYGIYTYFLMLIFIACFVPPVTYVYNTSCSMSKIIKISLSFVLATMFLPLIREVIKHTGSLPYDFIFLLFIVYFVLDLFWKKKKIIFIFFLGSIIFLLFSKIDLTMKKNVAEVAVEVPEELLTMSMKDTPTVYLFMYDSFPHKELIDELGLDRSELDDFLCEYQFKEYDLYSVGYYTLGTMAQVFNIHRIQDTDTDNALRKILGGDNLVSILFEKYGYDNFISTGCDNCWLFPSADRIKYKLVGRDDENSLSNSLSLVYTILKGKMNCMLRGNPKVRDACCDLSKFANSNGNRSEIFAWGVSDYPGHSSLSGRGFSYEFKRWKPIFYQSIQNMKKDLKLVINSNPDAIVILMSDHGPCLLDDARRRYPSLRDDQIRHIHFRDMFGAFMAIRWPNKERAAKYDKEFNITQDLFPIVFAYLCDSAIPLKYKIKDTAVRIRDHRFDKGVFYPNSYKKEEK